MAEQETTVQAPKKSSKKLIFIGGGAVVAIGVIVAVLFLTGIIGGGKKAAHGPENPAHAAKPAEPEAPKATVDLDPFVVNLADVEQARYLKVKMVIELTSENLKPQMEKLKPKIQDTIILLLTSKTYDQIRDGKGKLKLKQELTLRLNEILGTNAVGDVLFTEFIVS